jgi:hypothetical protein
VTNVLTPLPVLFRKLEFQIESLKTPDEFSTDTPCWEKFAQTISSIMRLAAAITLTQLIPFPAPLIDMPRSFTCAVELLTMTPLTSDARIEPCVSSQSMVIDFVIRHCAVTGRIETIDLTVRSRLRNRSGERLAGSRSAARVDVIADTRHPSTRRLCVCNSGKGENKNKETKDLNCRFKISHIGDLLSLNNVLN